jgi:hypothetical protein
MSRIVLRAAFALAVAFPASAAPLIPFDLETSVGASVELTGPTGVVAGNGNSDVQDTSAIADVTGLHAQAAGRSRLGAPQTIAANASYAATRFTGLDSRGQGDAIQMVTLAAPAGSLSMHFVLPSLLLEISDNVERLGAGGVPIGGDLFTQVQASIDLRVNGGWQINLFSLVGRLEGNFTTQVLTVQVGSPDPALDLSAFDGQAPSFSGDLSFIRTATWEFPTFEGDLDLSAYGGNIIEIEYSMAAIVEGRADITSAAAAINDPFLFTTDPTGGSALLFDIVPNGSAEPSAVPAPGGLGLLAVALGGLAAIRRAPSRNESQLCPSFRRWRLPGKTGA